MLDKILVSMLAKILANVLKKYILKFINKKLIVEKTSYFMVFFYKIIIFIKIALFYTYNQILYFLYIKKLIVVHFYTSFW